MKPFSIDSAPLSGFSLVEASAGTGKTYTITSLVLRMLVEQRRPLGEILVVTFTNAATAELRDRLRSRLREAIDGLAAGLASHGPPRLPSWLQRAAESDRQAAIESLQAALHGFDEASIFTIHGFCQRALQEHAFESGARFETELVAATDGILADVVADFWVAELHGASADWVRHLRASRTDPDFLGTIARHALAHPEATLIGAPPVEPAADELDALAAAAATAREPVERLWRRDREAILDLLCSDALDHNKIRIPSVREKWPPALDAAFAVAGPGAVARFPDLVKLGSSSLAQAAKRGREAAGHPFFDACDALVVAEARLTDALGRLELGLWRRAHERLPTELRRRLRDAGLQSFDGLLYDLWRALCGPQGEALAAAVRARHPVALVDEFQDTDPIQYEIFHRLYAAPGATAIFVGDPKQAIYSFRGADVYAYLRARRVADEQTYTLARNWRTDPPLIHATNTLLASHTRPFALTEIAFASAEPQPEARERIVPAKPALRFLTFAAAEGESLSADAARDLAARGTAAEIVRLLGSRDRIRTADGERPPQAGDCAVLCRTNAQADRVAAALAAVAVPAVVQSRATVFESREADEVERIVRALAEPRDAARVRAAIATSILGGDASYLDRLQVDEVDWESWLLEFADLHHRWLHDGFAAAFATLLERREASTRLLGLAQSERRLTNVRHLAELLHAQDSAAPGMPRALVRWLHDMRHDSEFRRSAAGDDALIRLETDADAVRVATIHRSKGLEYPIVFCPFLWDNQQHDRGRLVAFHDPESGELRVSLADKHDHPAEAVEQAKVERDSEDLRLLYVALTRARHRCYVVWGSAQRSSKSPLAHFLGVPAADPGENLRELVVQSASAIGVEPLDPETATWQAARPTILGLQRRQALRRLRPSLGLSSFSSMLAHAAAADERDGLDHDAGTAPSPPLVDDRGEAVSRIALDEFPAGRDAGDFFHAVLERLDFGALDNPALSTTVADFLPRFGIDSEHASRASSALEAALHTPLPHDRGVLRLDQIPRRDRTDEMGFLFPARSPRGAAARATRLRTALVQHASTPAAREWARALGHRLQMVPDGHVRGFIDLVFRHEGRWFVADYKSNHLGPHVDDYQRPQLERAMAEHDYFLQAHLYTLALVLHLRRRCPGFSYERDFGGVYYLFLRGMDPRWPQGTGVYFDRPAAALIGALERAFVGGER